MFHRKRLNFGIYDLATVGILKHRCFCYTKQFCLSFSAFIVLANTKPVCFLTILNYIFTLNHTLIYCNRCSSSDICSSISTYGVSDTTLLFISACGISAFGIAAGVNLAVYCTTLNRNICPLTNIGNSISAINISVGIRGIGISAFSMASAKDIAHAAARNCYVGTTGYACLRIISITVIFIGIFPNSMASAINVTYNRAVVNGYICITIDIAVLASTVNGVAGNILVFVPRLNSIGFV